MSLSHREIELREKPIKALFWQFSIPAITGMIVQALYNIVDRIFIGHMPHNSALAMGGLGISMPILFILMGFSMLFGIGAGANISIRLGEKNEERAQKIFRHALLMLGISSVILVIIGLAQTDNLLRLFGATPNNLPYARDYLRIILIGNLWNTFAFAFTHMIRAEGAPKVAMVSMLLGAITNTILDPIFIYTFDMGVQGAAYATIIAQFVSFLWSLRYYFSSQSVMKLGIVKKFDYRIVLGIMAIGVSPFFIQIAGSLVGALMNNQLKFYGGEVAQSAYISFLSITQLFFMPIFGMNQGLQPIIGFNYGAKNYNRAIEANNVGLKYATLLCTVGWLLCLLIPETLVSFVTNDPQVLKISSEGLRIFESMMFVVGISIISSNFFQSIGKAKISFFMSSLRQLLLLTPLILILPQFFGLKGIWMATPIADVTATIVTFSTLMIYYKKIAAMSAATPEIIQEQ